MTCIKLAVGPQKRGAELSWSIIANERAVANCCGMMMVMMRTQNGVVVGKIRNVYDSIMHLDGTECANLLMK